MPRQIIQNVDRPIGFERSQSLAFTKERLTHAAPDHPERR